MQELVENNKNYFKGQEFNIALDTHKSNFKVSIRNNGRVLKSFAMDPDPKQLHKYMEKNYPGGKYNSVYEAGFSGFWLHRELTSLGFNNIVVNPSDVPTTQKEKSRKTDKVDCAKLARELENRSLQGIYIPSMEEEALRNLSRLRTQIVKENTRTKNRIKSFLALYNIKLPENSEEKHWSKNFIERIKAVKFLEERNAMVRDNLITELEHQRKRKLEILKSIRKICLTNDIIKKLTTVPGIGLVIAFSLYAELYNMERFKKVDEVCSMIGLVPSIRESDETKYNLGLSIRASKILRPLIIEAAWTASRKDPVLIHAFNDYCKRMSRQKAIIRIARKLVSRIRHVWINKKEYVYGVIK